MKLSTDRLYLGVQSMEARTEQTPVAARVIEKAAARAAEGAAASDQQKEIDRPLIV